MEIPGYRIIREIGRGGMATVYLAMQESIEREVALKVMLPSLSADPGFAARFLREAKIIAQLSHPNIIAVYDVGAVGDHHFFSMEYHPGGELKIRIKAGLSIREIIRITRDLAAALGFAHKKGYIHRDIKPGNVLFRHDGSAVLSDFGIARAHDSATKMTMTGSVVGTPHYMSPEQAQGKDIDGRADLYSLGIVFYEMITGVVPYKGDSALSIGIKHISEPIPDLPEAFAMYQPFLNKLLAKAPEDRWASGDEIVAYLDATAPTSGADLTPPPVAAGPADRTMVIAPPVGARRKGRRALLWSVVLAALAGAGSWYGYQRVGWDRQPAQAPVAETVPQSSPIDQTRQEVDVLLGAAALAMQADPTGAAAYEKYREVLRLDPDNAAARRGLDELAAYQLAAVERALAAGHPGQAQRHLRRLAEVAPGHARLAALQEEVLAAREQQAAARVQARQRLLTRRVPDTTRTEPGPEARVDALLKQADDYLRPNDLTAARIERARRLFREAAGLAGDDSRVRDGPRRIVDAYVRIATNKKDQKDYDVAEALIKRGLQIDPGNNRLLALQDEIDKERRRKHRVFGAF